MWGLWKLCGGIYVLFWLLKIVEVWCCYCGVFVICCLYIRDSRFGYSRDWYKDWNNNWGGCWNILGWSDFWWCVIVVYVGFWWNYIVCIDGSGDCLVVSCVFVD